MRDKEDSSSFVHENVHFSFNSRYFKEMYFDGYLKYSKYSTIKCTCMSTLLHDKPHY